MSLLVPTKIPSARKAFSPRDAATEVNPPLSLPVLRGDAARGAEPRRWEGTLRLPSV